MSKLFSFFMLLFFIVGCAAVKPVIQIPEHTKTTFSVVGQEHQANLGEPMIAEEDLYFYNGFAVPSDFTPPQRMGMSYPTIERGTKLKHYGTLDNGDRLFVVVDYKPTTFSGDPVQWNYCVTVNSTNAAYGDTPCQMVFVSTWPQALNLQEARVYEKGSIRKELIYNGKAGNTIRVAYREFKDDFARPAFAQDLSYDLAESKIIGFKMMRIEVVEATNSYIKFIVKSSMD